MASVVETANQAENGRDVKEEARGVLKSLRRLFDQLGPIRLASTFFFLLLAAFIGKYSWDTPLIQDAERALYDMRASAFAPEVEKDERIVLIVYNEDTLKLTGQRSPVDRTILAQSLETIDAAGAKAIGIDILFDMPQDDDPLLVSAFKGMQTPTYLAYADPKLNPEIDFAQHQYLTRYLAELEGTKVKPTSIDLRTDSDGVQRRWSELPADLPPFLSIALTGENPKFAQNEGALRYYVPTNLDVPVFDKFPIESFADPATAEVLASFIKDKYVLIGGDFIDRDRFDTPIGAVEGTSGEDGKMIGLEIHAHMLAQLLNDDLPETLPNWTLWIAAFLIVICGGLSALTAGRAIIVAGLLIIQFAFLLFFPFLLQRAGLDTLTLPAFGWAIALAVWLCIGRIGRTGDRIETASLCTGCAGQISAEVHRQRDYERPGQARAPW